MDFNDFLNKLKDYESKHHMFVVNQIQLKKVENAFDIVKAIVSKYSPDAKVEMELNTPFSDGSAVIKVETDDFVVENVNEFISVIKDASNFEVYPVSIRKMKINIMYQNVMTLIK